MDFASYGTQLLHAAAVCSVRGSLSPLDCSMPIVQIASKALHDANDALLGVHCITRITRPYFHCFSDPRSPPPSSEQNVLNTPLKKTMVKGWF